MICRNNLHSPAVYNKALFPTQLCVQYELAENSGLIVTRVLGDRAATLSMLLVHRLERGRSHRSEQTLLGRAAHHPCLQLTGQGCHMLPSLWRGRQGTSLPCSHLFQAAHLCAHVQQVLVTRPLTLVCVLFIRTHYIFL